MEKKDLVSVLICVYNGEHYLRGAIDSVLSQDYKNLEIVMIDDGSTDNTEKIAKSFTDKRLKYYKNETNVGLTRSLNIGLKHCSGRYVCRIDHDDFCLPGRIRKQVAFLESQGYVLAGGWARVVDENGGLLRTLKPVTDPDLIHFRLCFSNVFIHSATLFLREAALQVGGYDESFPFSQDYDLWCRLSRVGRVGNLGDFVVSWRDHSQGISASRSSDQRQCSFQISRAHRKEMLPGLVNHPVVALLSGLAESKKIARLFLRQCEIEDFAESYLRQVGAGFKNKEKFCSSIVETIFYFVERDIFCLKSNFLKVTPLVRKKKEFKAFLRIIIKATLGPKNTKIFQKKILNNENL